jgi:hypothetical protein
MIVLILILAMLALIFPTAAMMLVVSLGHWWWLPVLLIGLFALRGSGSTYHTKVRGPDQPGQAGHKATGG